jgi:hypothetical protein
MRLSRQTLLKLTGALSVVLASFWITLQALDYWSRPVTTDYRPVAERLADRRVSTLSELASAAQDVGLQPSRRIKGHVDVLRRVSDREVTIAGWLADLEGDGTSLNVLLYAGGPAAMMAQTKGERPDVTQALSLNFGAEKNVSFSINFSCKLGEQLIVVGINPATEYTIVDSKKCP